MFCIFNYHSLVEKLFVKCIAVQILYKTIEIMFPLWGYCLSLSPGIHLHYSWKMTQILIIDREAVQYSLCLGVCTFIPSFTKNIKYKTKHSDSAQNEPLLSKDNSKKIKILKLSVNINNKIEPFLCKCVCLFNKIKQNWSDQS